MKKKKEIIIKGFIKLQTYEDGLSGWIELIFGLLFFMVLIAFFLSWPVVYRVGNDAEEVARVMTRAIETTGEINDDVKKLFHDMQVQYNLPDATIEYPYDYCIYGTNKLQLRKRFKIIVETTVKIQVATPKFGDPIELEFPIKKEITGISQIYWKSGEL